MDLAGAQQLTCFLPTTSRLPSHIHDSRRNGTAIIFSYDGLARVGQADRLVRLGPASDPAQRYSHADFSRSSLDYAI
jgi:hypothetical protein